MTVKVAVIYYSATGNVHALAQAVAEGAASAGAEVRLRREPRCGCGGSPSWHPTA
jgi:NAD(P)H dehydrogenase (quinone)